MNIYENLENLNVSEACFNDIISITEKIIKQALYSGYPEKDENKYIVTSYPDNGTLKTTTWADSPKTAVKNVNSFEGGPERAHQILVKDNPQRTAEEVKKTLDNGKRKLYVGVAKRTNKGTKNLGFEKN